MNGIVSLDCGLWWAKDIKDLKLPLKEDATANKPSIIIKISQSFPKKDRKRKTTDKQNEQQIETQPYW